jgi:hypothetical protein
MNRKQRRSGCSSSFPTAMQKMYTEEEVKKMIELTMKINASTYDARYSQALAVALSTDPLNFGPKRVCRTVKLFFDQLDGLRLGTITDDQIAEEAKKLGVVAKTTDKGTFEVYIDPSLKKVRMEDIK